MDIQTLIKQSQEQINQDLNLSFDDEPKKLYNIKNENGYWLVINKETNQKFNLQLGDSIEFYNPTEAHDSKGKWCTTTFGTVIGWTNKQVTIRYRSYTFLMGDDNDIYYYYPIQYGIEKSIFNIGWIAAGICFLFLLATILTIAL